jgi:hypothetical protein
MKRTAFPGPSPAATPESQARLRQDHLIGSRALRRPESGRTNIVFSIAKSRLAWRTGAILAAIAASGALGIGAASASTGLTAAPYAGAGAGSAPAAVAKAPPGARTITITATKAPGGTSPQGNGQAPSVILPCAAVGGATCAPDVITCWINVYTPGTTPPPVQVIGLANVTCDAPVKSIELTEHLQAQSATVAVDHVLVTGVSATGTAVVANSCQPFTTYTNSAIGFVEFPTGYVTASGSLHDSAAFTASFSDCNQAPPGGGGGGGGGCLIPAQAPSAPSTSPTPFVLSCP